tara:strand:- start:327 stop:980 length:654 start_codon:yes stop_codon:yes gene_type:complete
MSHLITYDFFNICDIIISDILYKNRRKFANVGTTDSNRIQLQTPKMFIPFGISQFGNNLSLDLSFYGIENDANVRKFYVFCHDLDEFILKHAVANSTDWFGSSLSEDDIYQMYKPVLKPGKQKSKDEYYPDTIRIKIPKEKVDGDWINKTVSILEEGKNDLQYSDIKRGSKISTVFEISPVWFMNNTFGISLSCVSIKLDNTKNNSLQVNGYSFEDD